MHQLWKCLIQKWSSMKNIMGYRFEDEERELDICDLGQGKVAGVLF